MGTCQLNQGKGGTGDTLSLNRIKSEVTKKSLKMATK